MKKTRVPNTHIHKVGQPLHGQRWGALRGRGVPRGRQAQQLVRGQHAAVAQRAAQRPRLVQPHSAESRRVCSLYLNTHAVAIRIGILDRLPDDGRVARDQQQHDPDQTHGPHCGGREVMW